MLLLTNTYSTLNFMFISTPLQYNYEEVPDTPHILYNNNVVSVGTHCQLAMVSTKMKRLSCGSACFCYEPPRVKHSRTTECYVQGVCNNFNMHMYTI